VFFISLGLLVNVGAVGEAGPELLLFGVALFGIAFVTKLAGCGVVARWTGMSRQESLAVGFGMVPRGEVGLIIALVAQQAGVIGADLFSIIVLVMVAVSVMPAPILRRYLIRIKAAEARAPPAQAAPPQGPF
jgi:Kef-type K+ transport system membrane component KefB